MANIKSKERYVVQIKKNNLWTDSPYMFGETLDSLTGDIEALLLNQVDLTKVRIKVIRIRKDPSKNLVRFLKLEVDK